MISPLAATVIDYRNGAEAVCLTFDKLPAFFFGAVGGVIILVDNITAPHYASFFILYGIKTGEGFHIAKLIVFRVYFLFVFKVRQQFPFQFTAIAIKQDSCITHRHAVINKPVSGCFDILFIPILPIGREHLRFIFPVGGIAQFRMVSQQVRNDNFQCHLLNRQGDAVYAVCANLQTFFNDRNILIPRAIEYSVSHRVILAVKFLL